MSGGDKDKDKDVACVWESWMERDGGSTLGGFGWVGAAGGG